MPIDLSKVLFLCTANMLDTLHPAVLDRMEIIEIAGYTANEKRHIFENYLLPEAIKKSGLIEGMHKFEFKEDVKDFIIENYAREAGVRSLKKFTNKICEKVAFKIVESDNTENIVVDKDTVIEMIGHPIFSTKKIYGQ